MGLLRRKFTREVKITAIQQLESGSSIAEVARAFEVNPNLLHRWRKEFRHGPGNAFPGVGKRRWEETKVVQLERKPAGAGDRFFGGVLAAHRRTADAAGVAWKAAIHRHIQAQIEKGIQMTGLRMCDLGLVSRAGLYRFEEEAEPADDDLDLRDDIQRIALEYPYYGRPRITAELRRRGWEVNHKRVGRIMREDNLLGLRRRKFVVTTDSNHNLQVYPNLAKDMELTGIDQVLDAS